MEPGKEMVVMETGNEIVTMKQNLESDLMTMGDFSSIMVKSKEIAKQTGKSHNNLVRDFKKISLTMAGGKEIHKISVNGGLAYDAWSNKNINELFITHVEEKIDESEMIHPYFQGLTVERDNRGYISNFTVNGNTALHILMKSDDILRWDFLEFTNYLYNKNIELTTERVMGYIKPEHTREEMIASLTDRERILITLEVNSDLANRAINMWPDEKLQVFAIKDDDNKEKRTYRKRAYKKRIGDSPLLGVKTGMRYINGDIFDMAEEDTFTVNEVADKIFMDYEILRTYLLGWKIIDREAFINKKTVPESYSVMNKWMIESPENMFDYNYDGNVIVYETLITARGLQHICRRLIKEAKNYRKTGCAKRVDLTEIMDNPVVFYKKHSLKY